MLNSTNLFFNAPKTTIKEKKKNKKKENDDKKVDKI